MRPNAKKVLCRYCQSGSGFIINKGGGLSCKFCGKENYRYDDKNEEYSEGGKRVDFST